MKSKQELLTLLNKTHGTEEGRASVEGRGLPYYGQLQLIYPIHMRAFKLMHARAKLRHLDVDFPRSGLGFVSFLLYVEDIPAGMCRPSLGREDHSLGYLRGNFRWQELEENTRESLIRNIKDRNPKMRQVQKILNSQVRKQALIEKASISKKLTDKQVMRITHLSNQEAHRLVLSMLRAQKLSGHVDGSRRQRWCLVAS